MSHEKVIIGDCTLYCGDAREVCKNELADFKADLAATDAPYKLTSGGNNGKHAIQMRGKFSRYRYDNKGNIVDCDITWNEVMELLYKHLADNAHCYSMCNSKNMRRMLNAAHKAKFREHTQLPWDKGTGTPNRWYMQNCEFAWLFFKGKAFAINDCGSRQLIYVPQEAYGGHPTPKPTLLMQAYVENSSQRGQVVFDPFMGTAPVGVACMRTGRKFVGIERDPKWFSVAVKRLEKEYGIRKGKSHAADVLEKPIMAQQMSLL